jgi:hypothetical protein
MKTTAGLLFSIISEKKSFVRVSWPSAAKLAVRRSSKDSSSVIIEVKKEERDLKRLIMVFFNIDI